LACSFISFWADLRPLGSRELLEDGAAEVLKKAYGALLPEARC
ncbi:hypothetical protein BAE44_0007762, partial [Dichanthelium oligosanthes]